MPQEPNDAVALGGEAFVGFESGAVSRYPTGGPTPLRTFVSARRQGAVVFGIGSEFYSQDETGKIDAVSPNLLPQPRAGYEPSTMDRLWVNRRWVLRAFDTIAGRFWEASQRLEKGAQAHIVAYGGLGACGEPLDGDNALILDSRGERVDVVAVSLIDRREAWRAEGVPLDDAHCVAAENGVVAVGGARGGIGAVAILSKGRWRIAEIGSSGSAVEPVVRQGLIVAAAPGDDYTAVGDSGDRVKRAGAVYILGRRGDDWVVATRVVAEHPSESGLFGFRAVVGHQQLLVNHYGGVRGANAEQGIPAGPAEICRVALPGRP